MKESTIMAMNKQRAQNDILLYKQFHFLMTRIQAYEDTLSNTWNIIRSVVSPSWLKQEVDHKHMILLKAHDEQVREVTEKEKIKNRITVL